MSSDRAITKGAQQISTCSLLQHWELVAFVEPTSVAKVFPVKLRVHCSEHA